jgi:hypothetical protein
MGGHFLVLLVLLSLGELRQSHRYKKIAHSDCYVYYCFTIYILYSYNYVTKTTLLFTNSNSSEGNNVFAVSNGNKVTFTVLCPI